MNLKRRAVCTGFVTVFFLIGLIQPISAQQNGSASLPPKEASVPAYTASYTAPEMASLTPTARPGDVSSPEALLAALHDSVSGPAGPVDWERYRSLFLPAARTVNLRIDAQGVKRTVITTVDEEIATDGVQREKVAWYEVILVSHIEKFDNIAFAIDSSDGRMSRDGKSLGRAITTTEMLYDGKRWWIASTVSDVLPLAASLPPELDPSKQKN
jgi:hypothetical protein